MNKLEIERYAEDVADRYGSADLVVLIPLIVEAVTAIIESWSQNCDTTPLSRAYASLRGNVRTQVRTRRIVRSLAREENIPINATQLHRAMLDTPINVEQAHEELTASDYGAF